MLPAKVAVKVAWSTPKSRDSGQQRGSPWEGYLPEKPVRKAEQIGPVPPDGSSVAPVQRRGLGGVAARKIQIQGIRVVRMSGGTRGNIELRGDGSERRAARQGPIKGGRLTGHSTAPPSPGLPSQGCQHSVSMPPRSNTKLGAKWQLDAALLSRPVDLTALVSLSQTSPDDFYEDDTLARMVKLLLNAESDKKADKDTRLDVLTILSNLAASSEGKRRDDIR